MFAPSSRHLWKEESVFSGAYAEAPLWPQQETLIFSATNNEILGGSESDSQRELLSEDAPAAESELETP